MYERKITKLLQTQTLQRLMKYLFTTLTIFHQKKNYGGNKDQLPLREIGRWDSF